MGMGMGSRWWWGSKGLRWWFCLWFCRVTCTRPHLDLAPATRVFA